MKTLIALSAAATFSFTLAQAQDKSFNAKNNWDASNVSVTSGYAYGIHGASKRTATPVFQFKAENMNAGTVLRTGDAIAGITVGYMPSGFLRLSYKLRPSANPDAVGKTYWIVPLIGDMDLRPGNNQMKHKLGENLSAKTSYIGFGYQTHGTTKSGNTWRADANIKYLAFNEMMSPGSYTSAAAAAWGRDAVNTIDTRGFASEIQGQMAIMNKYLLGFGGEGAKLYQKNENGGADIAYYNYEGTLYARVRVLGKNKLTLDLDAQWYLRFTNMTDQRTDVTRSYPGIGARVGF